MLKFLKKKLRNILFSLKLHVEVVEVVEEIVEKCIIFVEIVCGSC